MAGWIEETSRTIPHDPIVAPPDELLTALDGLIRFIRERLYELGAKQAPSGIYSVADEHVEEVGYLLQAHAACIELQDEVEAQIACWTIDREQRDELHPLVVKALKFLIPHSVSTSTLESAVRSNQMIPLSGKSNAAA